MPEPAYILVTAPTGRVTPIHATDGFDPGGGLLYVTDGTVCRVRYSQAIRRAIARADLFPCDMNGAAVGLELATAPDDIGGKVRLPSKKGAP